MGKFNQGDKFDGKKRFDSNRGFRKGERSKRSSMHKAICAECGKECEVPFMPTSGKPVLCSDCFGKKGASSNSRFKRRASVRPSFGDKRMFKAICDKCHKECEVPFRPTSGKPVLCSDCFGKSGKSGSSNNAVSSDRYKIQFEMLNSKLDNILKILSPKTSIEKTVKEEKPVIKSAKKAVKKKIEIKKVAAPKKVVKKVIAKKKNK